MEKDNRTVMFPVTQVWKKKYYPRLRQLETTQHLRMAESPRKSNLSVPKMDNSLEVHSTSSTSQHKTSKHQETWDHNSLQGYDQKQAERESLRHRWILLYIV